MSCVEQSVVLVMCGSFNPLTYTHLRVMEMSRDLLQYQGIKVVGGILSPVHDDYYSQKRSLMPALHRRVMVKLTLAEQLHNWIWQSEWEMRQEKWSCTLDVLEEYRRSCSEKYSQSVRIVLVCGIDMLIKMADRSSWDSADVDEIFTKYGLLVHLRRGYDEESVMNCFPVWYRDHIQFVHNTVCCEVSSTEVRSLVSKGLSVRFLISEKVIQYIRKHGLYTELTNSALAPSGLRAEAEGGSTGDYELFENDGFD